MICTRATGEMYVRNKTTGTWSATWDSIALNNKFTSQFVTNLNDAVNTGFYDYNNSGSNIPMQYAGNVLVIAGSNVITQLAMSVDKVFVRRYANGAWNNWTER